jgi:hypothetical protein
MSSFYVFLVTVFIILNNFLNVKHNYF